jgi:hypothetical protein
VPSAETAAAAKDGVDEQRLDAPRQHALATKQRLERRDEIGRAVDEGDAVGAGLQGLEDAPVAAIGHLVQRSIGDHENPAARRGAAHPGERRRAGREREDAGRGVALGSRRGEIGGRDGLGVDPAPLQQLDEHRVGARRIRHQR